jgi:hypothetical protein
MSEQEKSEVTDPMWILVATVIYIMLLLFKPEEMNIFEWIGESLILMWR